MAHECFIPARRGMIRALILTALLLTGCQRATLAPVDTAQAERAAANPAVAKQLRYLGLTPEGCRLYGLGDAQWLVVCPTYGGYSVAGINR